MTFRHPGIPDVVEGLEVVHCLEIDGGGEQMLAVSADFFQQRIDTREHAVGLIGDIAEALFRPGDLTTQVDGVVVDDGAAHACLGIVTLDIAHGECPCAVLLGVVKDAPA